MLYAHPLYVPAAHNRVVALVRKTLTLNFACNHYVQISSRSWEFWIGLALAFRNFSKHCAKSILRGRTGMFQHSGRGFTTEISANPQDAYFWLVVPRDQRQAYLGF